MKYLVEYQPTDRYTVQDDEIEADSVEIIAEGIVFYEGLKLDSRRKVAFYKMESFIKFKVVEE